MKVPNADHAVIAEDKLCNYLLNLSHRQGAAKARLLMMMGYRLDQWQRLETDIRAQHLTAEVDGEADTEYGKRYEIVAPLHDPSGANRHVPQRLANRRRNERPPLDYHVPGVTS